MRTLLLDHDHEEKAAKMLGKAAARSHAPEIIDTDTKVVTPDGHVIAVFLKQRIDPELYKPAHKMWRTVRDLPSQRSQAAGAPSLPRRKKDGSLSKVHAVPVPVLDVLKAQGVRTGTMDKEHHFEEMVKPNEALIKRVDKLYRRHAPDEHAIQRIAIKQTPELRLCHTSFSSIYIAKSWRTFCHTDTANLSDVFTVLMTMGIFTGGELAMPRWGIAFSVRPGDLLLFNPQTLHGNLPFEGKRISAAFYCASKAPRHGSNLL